MVDSPYTCKVHSFGSDGKVRKSNSSHSQVTFLLHEYFPGLELFDLVEEVGPMGEEMGRHMLIQLVSAMEALRNKGIAHRDIKLENLLVDHELNLKLIDFGFAKKSNGGLMESYKGTKTYMAPEVRNTSNYDGHKADIFSSAVIIFTVVTGIFPFVRAAEGDKFWEMIKQGRLAEYWETTGS